MYLGNGGAEGVFAEKLIENIEAIHQTLEKSYSLEFSPKKVKKE